METNPHYDASGRPLVPPAERPFIPFQDLETVKETVWKNPTDKDVVLDLYIGVQPILSADPVLHARFRALKEKNPGEYRERQQGLRRYVIRAGQERSIPAEFDQGVQQTICQEQDCAARAMYCRDRSHHKMVIGGYGPQLINLHAQHRPTVHPSLVEAHAREQEALALAQEALRQKEAAETALVLAQANANKAAALRLSLSANEEAERRAHDAATAAPSAPAAPNAQPQAAHNKTTTSKDK